MKLTAADVAEALTSGDNDYNDNLDGWFSLLAQDNEILITWTDGETKEKQYFTARVDEVEDA